MEVQTVEETKAIQLFEWIDSTTEKVINQTDEPYLDSLNIVLEAVFNEGLENREESLIQTVNEALKQVTIHDYDQKAIAKAIQFAVLKGMKSSTQVQHMMTPEAIALFVGYLVNKLTKNEKSLRLFDPASGTGNLLFHVMDQIDKDVEAYASEIDPTLLTLSLYSANLQEKSVEFFHQDSIQPFLLDPVDLVVCDLPVGYYPDDVRASEFAIHAKEGHTYAHHLFIEQSMTYVKDGGYVVCLIPDNLFESEQADLLKNYIQQSGQIVGVLQLADSTFKDKSQRKSILILRKKGDNLTVIKQPLLAMLPSFNDAEKMEDIVVKINQWFEEAGLS